ncbi:MAG: O-antigen ligase family protein [Nitrospira sp.]|nr:O-antigen ligase family protein [Nitrospira sp.]
MRTWPCTCGCSSAGHDDSRPAGIHRQAAARDRTDRDPAGRMSTMSELESPQRTQTRLNLEGYVLAAWVLLATLAPTQSRYQPLLIAPWCLLALRYRASFDNLVALARAWPVPLAASVLLAIWLALGAEFGPPALTSRYNLAAIAVTWIPVAALVAGQRRAGRHIEGLLAAMLLLVVALNAVRVGHQLFTGRVPLSGYTHNVLLGPLMIALALTAAALLVRCQAARRRCLRVAAAGLVIAVAIAIASRARTPFVAATAAVFATVVVWRLKLSRAIWIGLASALAVWLAAISTRWELVVTQSIQYEGGATHKTSIGARVDMLRWGARHLHEIPPFGFGEPALANYMNQRFAEFGVDPTRIYQLIHMHNDILQLSFAHGWVAGLCFVVFMVSLLTGVYARRRTASADGQRGDFGSATCTAAVLLLALAGWSDSFLYWPKVWLALVAVFAIVTGLHTPIDDRHAVHPAARMRNG